MRDADYCSDPQQVDVFPGVPEALRRLKAKGYKLIVITNQSGISRGFFTLKQYRAVEAEVLRQLGDDLINATYFCPHRPDEGCKCRKPSPQMITQAAREHTVDLGRSFFVGDKKAMSTAEKMPASGLFGFAPGSIKRLIMIAPIGLPKI